jgi:hypothetical protein
MDLQDFIKLVKGSKQQSVFFHFTDTLNIPSIKEHGLLSTRELARAGLKPIYGGNQWSLDQDKICGMDKYVHLCFRPSHPMEHLAVGDGRIAKSTFISIKPEIILVSGALITDEVSNKAGVVPMQPETALDSLDLKVLYERTDWNNSDIQARLKAAEKYELLIPDRIILDHIQHING